eukprot:GFKZ01001358.1.p1 GENE.GFKZ01001358.1~~GFKZ01001358.1.p1  ORF type:complete len:1035 (+),score=144.33 GFKZ01001358.1:107-3211(+)
MYLPQSTLQTVCPAFCSAQPLSVNSPQSFNAATCRKRPNHTLRRARVVLAVQTSPVSGDSDGDISEAPPPQKSYSVGVTIVSGCDDQLRREVIEKIASNSDAGRVVVVTAGGLPFTDEHENGTSVLVPDPASEVNGFATAKLYPLKNLEGWISCSSPQEQAEVVAKLAASRECDYIIAEGSSVASLEPQEFAHLLQRRGGASLRIDSLVSVLNGDTLLHDLSAHPSSENCTAEDGRDSEVVDSETAQEIQQNLDTRPMMLVSLVENANVILVSRSAKVIQNEELQDVTDLLSVLNGSASILPATAGEIPVKQLVNTNAYDYDSMLLGATWKKVLIASRNTGKGPTNRSILPKSLKDATFVYRARRPFHPLRLYQHIKAVATFNGVIRSTGRIWLATRMLAPLVWNQAGVAATLSLGKLFWAAVPESEWPAEEEDREKIMENWDNQYGDRETEIVFIGMGIDKERLQGLLDGCLLQDEEMVFTNLWENFEDPFVEWVPLIEDDDSQTEEKQEQTTIVPPPVVETLNTVEGDNEVDPKFRNTQLFSTPDVSSSDIDQVAEKERGEGPSDKSSDTGSASSPGKEGVVNPEHLPDQIYDRVNSLDFFAQGFHSDDNTGRLLSQPSDDGEFDREDVVISSWAGDVADGILQQVPRKGLPVTLVTGFLGSGKTTLLNFVLTANHGLRIAVLINEFGEIDIDNQLIDRGTWETNNEVLRLANGCICCTVSDSFLEAVATILQREEQADYLIIETTGIADPVPVINSLMVSEIAEQLRVDGILTLVDAENFNIENHMGSEAALSQIMAADTILLSKTDIATPRKVQETIDYIKTIRPAARILRSQRGRVPLNMILDVGVRVADSLAHVNPGRQNETSYAPLPEKDREDGPSRHDHNEATHEHVRDRTNHPDDHSSHGHDHDHHEECESGCSHESRSHDRAHSNHLEEDGFVTTSFKSDVPLDLEMFMEKFLRRLPEGVFRAKGLLQFYGFGSRYVFQLSGRRYQFDEDEWPEGVAPGNQLVIIGKELDIGFLRETLESCLVE